MSKIGIIGITGKMGNILAEMVRESQSYSLGRGYSSCSGDLIEVFSSNDYVIDFSSHKLISSVLSAALQNPKPLIICTTGWDRNEYAKDIEKLAEIIPLIIASNTSIGAYLQRYLVRELAKLLGDDYDVDIIEKHHRNKVDSPSGTALSLSEDIKSVKQKEYRTSLEKSGKREDNLISINSIRSGNIYGEHEVMFTSSEEMISVKHVAFNRHIFAKGAIRALDWLVKKNPSPGIYSMQDVLGI
jgi:4-hydroxy-tetrahydrodipicolinate reductase